LACFSFDASVSHVSIRARNRSLASAFFRAFLHAYQGIDAVVLIFPLGLIFGFVYWKWRRLWPLFIAHVLFDLDAFFPR
jgi:membrane protease YdiL (CAAX protease family)